MRSSGVCGRPCAIVSTGFLSDGVRFNANPGPFSIVTVWRPIRVFAYATCPSGRQHFHRSERYDAKLRYSLVDSWSVRGLIEGGRGG